jgi:hypothetical protein
MASIVYPMILFIFCFAAVSAGINQMGLYEYKLPTTGVTAQLDDIQEINTGMVETGKNPALLAIDQLTMFGKCIVAGLLAIVTLGPLMASYGIPASIYTMFISPLGFVVLMWIGEYWLGRPTE